MFQFVLRPLTRIFHVRSVVTAFDVVRPKERCTISGKWCMSSAGGRM